MFLPLQSQNQNAEIAQLVEHDLAKVGVASSSLVFRSKSKSFEDEVIKASLKRSFKEALLFSVRKLNPPKIPISAVLQRITQYLIKHSIYPHCEQLISHRINLVYFSNNISL